MRHKQGKLIVIDGIDQSGKKTQTQLLARKARSLGYTCSIWSFPDYTTPLGRQLKNYLAGENQFDFHTVHLLYAANKWERASLIQNQIEHGRIVIINRYTPSNLAYGTSHGLMLNWLKSLEDELPRPDVVLILDVPPKVSFGRKRQRRDVHEESLPYLTNVRIAYLHLAKKFHWKIVSGTKDPRAVHIEVWKRVLPIMPARSRQSQSNLFEH